MSYYQHIDDFDGIIPVDNAMPADVKRLISHCKHNYLTRYYFFSPSQRKFYRYWCKDCYGYELNTIQNRKSPIVQLLPDENDGTKNTPNIIDKITISNRFMQRVEHMNKLILPNLRAK